MAHQGSRRDGAGKLFCDARLRQDRRSGTDLCGAGKAINLRKLCTELRIYTELVEQRGVSAYAYFAESTPQDVLDLAVAVFGKNKVRTFKDRK